MPASPPLLAASRTLAPVVPAPTRAVAPPLLRARRTPTLVPLLVALAVAGLAALLVGHAITLHALGDGLLVPQLLSPHPGTALEAATAAASLYASRAAVYFGVPPLLAGAAAWRLTRP